MNVRRPPCAWIRSSRSTRALDHVVELVLVEREPEVVDARQLPLAGLDDDVDGAALELGEPQLEAHLVELLPRDPGLERLVVLADPAVARDERERELADVARLDLAHAARDQVVVEELHGPRDSRVGAWTSPRC